MKNIFEYYNAQDEDIRLSLDRTHRLEYLTTMRYLEKVCPTNSTILDACAGTGAYCFDLAKKGHQVTAGDLVPQNIEMIEKKNQRAPILQKIYTGNILDLSMFDDNSFDVVLCLGAFYHLHQQTDRKQAVLECKRVVKSGGVIFIAYLNRFASFMNNFSHHPDNFENIINEFYTGNKNVFYRSNPIEIEALMAGCQITMLNDIGTDGTAFMYPNQLETLSNDDYDKYLEYHFNTCDDKSILGYSLHGLYIGKK
jgi:ubiquinone/menaquinone biosynthesis C-methylase UbiE